jgi:TatA/E family protein of Tat protein translocase
VFSLGSTEIVIILVVALLLFGPDKIPQLARTIGRFTKEFNKYKDIMESTIRMEFNNLESPAKDELTVEERIAKAGDASADNLARDRSLTGAAADGPDAESETDDEAAPAVSHPVARPSADESDEEDEG